MVMVPAA